MTQMTCTVKHVEKAWAIVEFEEEKTRPGEGKKIVLRIGSAGGDQYHVGEKYMLEVIINNLQGDGTTPI